MYPISCLHSPVLVYLSCFHVLVIVPSTAIIVGYKCLFKFWFSLDLCPGYGIAGLLGTSMFSFLRTSIIFSLVDVLTDIPTNSVGGFPFLYTLCRLYCCRVFRVAILINVKWYLIVHLICLSLRTSDAEHRFMCFMAISITSLEKCAFILWPIFYWVFFFYIELY